MNENLKQIMMTDIKLGLQLCNGLSLNKFDCVLELWKEFKRDLEVIESSHFEISGYTLCIYAGSCALYIVDFVNDGELYRKKYTYFNRLEYLTTLINEFIKIVENE